MPVLLPNILITTARSQYNSATGTTQPQIYLVGVAGHIGPVRASQLAVLPPDAVTSQLSLLVPSGTDIIVGDTIMAMTLNDGVTVWPAFNDTASYIVRFTQETAPMILAARMVYIEIVITSGPAF